jgi:FkbM family methyltransferase
MSLMDELAVPKSGESDKRNTEYETNYSPVNFFHSVVNNANPVILDVGAHKGESIIFFKQIFKFAKIFSFEPSSLNFEELKNVASLYETTAVNVAVGDVVGKVRFYEQSLSHLGGLLPINEKSTDSLGYAKNAENSEVLVDCITLNEALQRLDLVSIDILKIDVQGFEAGVLKGASEALSKTKVIMIEISLFDFYGESNNTWFDVNKILGEAGFQLLDIAKLSKNPKNLRTDWVELVFTKPN